MISRKTRIALIRVEGYIRPKFLADKSFWRNKIIYQCSYLKLNDNFQIVILQYPAIQMLRRAGAGETRALYLSEPLMR